MLTMASDRPIKFSQVQAWQLVLALLVVSLLPIISRQQLITGTIINATLLVSARLLGPGAAMALGCFPSFAALLGGLLPPPLMPMLPWIVLSNAVYISIFVRLGSTNPPAAVVIGGLVKYALLAAIAEAWLAFGLTGATNQAIWAMMGWPQLATALAGGLLAITLLRKPRLTT